MRSLQRQEEEMRSLQPYSPSSTVGADGVRRWYVGRLDGSPAPEYAHIQCQPHMATTLCLLLNVCHDRNLTPRYAAQLLTELEETS